MMNTTNTQTNKSMFSFGFYQPDERFRHLLYIECLQYIRSDRHIYGKNRFTFLNWLDSIKLSHRLLKLGMVFIFIGGISLYFNLNNLNLNNDFVLTQVYAQNPQTNLMPFMLISSGFNSGKEVSNNSFNPTFVPLADNVKKYNYGHVGYDIHKGDALKDCENVYPFPKEISRLEGYEYLDQKGEDKYKMIIMSKDGKVEEFLLLTNGEMIKLKPGEEPAKADLNILTRKVNIKDVIKQLPKTINISRINKDYLMLKWQKEILCKGKIEDMVIHITVNRDNYKIRNLSTFKNTPDEKNLLYSVDFVSKTSLHEYEEVKNSFENPNMDLDVKLL